MNIKELIKKFKAKRDESRAGLLASYEAIIEGLYNVLEDDERLIKRAETRRTKPEKVVEKPIAKKASEIEKEVKNED